MSQQAYAPAPPKKRRKWPIVLVGILVLLALLFAGCVALVGGAVNSIDKSIKESEKKNAPREVQVGKQFTVGKHQTLAGWKVKKHLRRPASSARHDASARQMLPRTRRHSRPPCPPGAHAPPTGAR